MKTRLPALGILLAVALVAAIPGCGSKADKDPKPANVKQDPRLKITGDGGGGGKVQAQTGGDSKAIE